MPSRVNNGFDASGYTNPTTQPPTSTAPTRTTRSHAQNHPMFVGLQGEGEPRHPVAGNPSIPDASTGYASFGYASSQQQMASARTPTAAAMPASRALSPERAISIQNFLETAWMQADVGAIDEPWRSVAPAALAAIQVGTYGAMTARRADEKVHHLDFSPIAVGTSTYSASLRISAEDGSGDLEIRCVDDESAIKCNVAWARTVSPTPTPVQFPAYNTLPASQRGTIDAALEAIRYLTPAQQVQHDDGSNTTVFTDIPSSGYRWRVTVHSTNDTRLGRDGTILTYPVIKIEARTGTWAITCRMDPSTPRTVATGSSYAGGTMYDPAAMSMRGPY